MAANSIVERNDERNLQSREETRSSENFIRPAVHITETEEGFFLCAEMPGTTKEQIEISVDKGILTLSAQARSGAPGTPAYREFELGNYYRQFAIPATLDHEHAKAEYVNGILTLKVPKTEAARPRRIEVQVG